MTLLPARMVDKPWGRKALPAPFTAPPGQTVGEVWFEPPPELPELLVKYIFTNEALSVQVHPSEAQTPGEGKEECWLVIAAEPGARLAVGFREGIAADAMRTAALDGSIEALLEWHPVQAGDFFHIPANTVHAIGAGVALIEVQQNSDTTYRLYDYGRPRDLHLEQAVAVAHGSPHDPRRRCHVPDDGHVTLCEGQWFRLDRIDGPPDAPTRERYANGPLLVIPRDGGVAVAGQTVAPGECALAHGIDALCIAQGAKVLIAQPTGVRPAA